MVELENQYLSTSSCVNYRIDDPEKILSKQKIKKIKQYLRQNSFKNKNFLEANKISFYQYADKTFSPHENAYVIRLFEKKPLTRKQIIRHKLEKYKVEALKNEKMDDAYSLYRKMKSLDPVKKLDESILKMALPEPKTIVENKEKYIDYVEKIPDSILKTYFKKCLDI